MERRYISRDIEKSIISAAKQFPVIALTGPRQSGKSTLLTHLYPDLAYITFDDPVVRRSAQEDPGLFTDRCPEHCIIDEVQYAPDILPYIKMRVDEDRSRTGRFFLTGSQVFPLVQGLTESLAGRVAVFELLGFTLSEYPMGGVDVSTLFRRCFIGTYPDPLVHGVERSTYYASYVLTYVERDVRHVENIQEVVSFQRFLELLAARVGNLLNFSEIAKETGVSQPTIRRWTSILETSRLVYLLRPFHLNTPKRTIKAPKLYFTDTGLLSYLLKYPDWRSLSAGPQAGALFENFVVSELLKEKFNTGYPYELYFYRDSNHNEIDLVIDNGTTTDLCEIKLAKTIGKKHYDALPRIATNFPEPKMYLISMYPERIALDRRVENIPVWRIPELVRDRYR
jgi:hypothetical protein